MLDWLTNAVSKAEHVPVAMLVQNLLFAFVLGCVIAGIYRFTHRRDEPYAPTFLTTLVLLTVLIALVTQVIGDNISRAFSLVGALSIIRFRTVVEDTRDTAFVIFAVVVGMAAGAGYLVDAAAGLLIVGGAAFLVRPRATPAAPLSTDWRLSVRVGVGNDPDALLGQAFGKHLARTALVATATGRQGAALDLTYQIAFLPAGSPTGLVYELNQIPGVQSVELRRG